MAGRTPRVGLDEQGLAQAAALVGRLVGVPLASVVASPLQRCRQTVAPLVACGANAIMAPFMCAKLSKP